MSLWPRGCRRDQRMLGTPKKCFDTLAEAQAHIGASPTMNAYYCTNCGYWHVGHKPGKGYGTGKHRSQAGQETRP